MRGAGVLAVAALVSLPAWSADPASPATSREAAPWTDLFAAAREIQNVCFAEYPPELLARMTGRNGPVPDEVRSDPRLQIEYLRTEDVSSKGLFYPSLLDDLIPALQAEIRPGRRFLDLGSGDGRVVFLAAFLGADAAGIEYERDLDHLARRARKQLAHVVPIERARLRRGDFFKEDLSQYDVLFYYCCGSYLDRQLLEKMAREMREDAVAILELVRGTPPGLERVATHGKVGVFRRAQTR